MGGVLRTFDEPVHHPHPRPFPCRGGREWRFSDRLVQLHVGDMRGRRMKLSYAQNLEDYHLELLLGDVVDGTYVDVGGGHPVADNVTFWFYLKGWRGLIVEPQAALAEAYRHIRPRDAVYQGLAGEADGEAEFHAVEGMHGLSSMDREAAERAEALGASFRTVRMPVRRLDGLIAEHRLPRIDVLKIDVEGAEDQVLAGLDLTRVTPRVLVVESVNPGNLDGKAGVWEARLLAAGYSLEFFDNLNRFYLAPDAIELSKRLPEKPTAWDKVDHLWDHGRAPLNPANADHELAMVLEHGLMALLPSLDASLVETALRVGLAARKLEPPSQAGVAALLGRAEFPGREPIPRDLDALLRTDRFRAALGRIACFYDGGHIVE